MSGELIRQAYADALEDLAVDRRGFRADIVATFDRDPATHRLIEPVLYLQGLPRHPDPSACALALEQGPQGFRLYLQSRSSAVFQCDIHPAARRSAAASSSTTPPALWWARPR